MSKKLKKTDSVVVDTQELSETMIQSIYLLESFLFSQVSSESKKIDSLRTVQDSLSETLFDEERMERYTFDQRVELYKLSAKSLDSSLKFMQDLHKNVVSGIETIKRIEDMKFNRNTDTEKPKQRKAVRQAREVLTSLLADKLKGD